MNTKTKTLLLALVFVAVIALAVYTYNALSENIQPENIGITQSEGELEDEKIAAPDFTVVNQDGNDVKLSDMFGKPIVLNFWASWCPPCMSEMPEFNTVYGETGEDIHFMMVDLVDGRRETKESGEKYIAEQGFTFPVYFDMGQEAARMYGITSIPTTIFIDKDGYIITGAQGAIDAETLRKGIELIK